MYKVPQPRWIHSYVILNCYIYTSNQHQWPTLPYMTSRPPKNSLNRINPALHNTGAPTSKEIYIYIYIYILFRCITTLPCGYTREMLQAEIGTGWLYVSRTSYPRVIVILNVSEGVFYVNFLYICYRIPTYVIGYVYLSTYTLSVIDR